MLGLIVKNGFPSINLLSISFTDGILLWNRGTVLTISIISPLKYLEYTTNIIIDNRLLNKANTNEDIYVACIWL